MSTAAPPDRTGPLKGLRVLELGVLLAGPFCGQLLGDMGADVIKIEPPDQGDPLRGWGQVRPEGVGLWFAQVARNKRCMTLDLRKPEGQALLLDLAAHADFIVENFRPGTLEKWGLGWPQLSARNPGLILVRVSGYGQTGPYASRAGYASVGEAFGGLRYVMGEPDRRPSRAGISLGDTLAATHACMGALAALRHRHETGQGQVVDASIYESVLAMMETLVSDYHFGGHIRERTGAILPKIAPSNIYETADGMVIIAANQDGVFARLCAAMEQPDLANDPRYLTHIARGDSQADLDARINAWTRSRTMAEIEATCEAHGVPCGRLLRAPEMLSDPHYAARQSIITADHPQIGPIPMPNVTPKLSQTPGSVGSAGPAHGEHTEEILRELLGFDAPRIENLRAAGVI